MKLSTGKVAFPIEFDNGDKDCIYFNPSDPDLVFRMKNVSNRVSEKTKEFDDIELSRDGTPIEFANIDIFEKMQNIVKQEIDYAFGGDVSAVVFKHCSPFAIVGGKYFFHQFMEAISPEIEKNIKKSNEDLKRKMSKHLDKYKK